MMGHALMKEKVFALYDRELAQDARQEVEVHLGECLECRAMYERWEMTAGVLFKEPLPAASEFFVQRVMVKIKVPEQLQLAPHWNVSLQWFIPPALALATMFFAVIRPMQPISVEAILLEDTPEPATWVLSSTIPSADQLSPFSMEENLRDFLGNI